ncbi:MAG: helix-turn-helix transcriptional regulator [Lentisphaeria bacterium]|nr:helix-turn-helix transcriptional regulator [Lentisphaeria bacterium]
MKNIDWAKQVVAIMDRLAISQAELAKRCKVAQQTVSTWKKGTRRPNVFARRQLMKSAGDAGLNLIFFTCGAVDSARSGAGYDDPGYDGRVAPAVAGTMAEGAGHHPPATEFVTVLQQLPPHIAEQVLAYARFKLDSHRRMTSGPAGIDSSHPDASGGADLEAGRASG